MDGATHKKVMGMVEKKVRNKNEGIQPPVCSV
jgi:hypothetical protein